MERFIVAPGMGAGAVPSDFAYTVVVPGSEYLLLIESTATI